MNEEQLIALFSGVTGLIILEDDGNTKGCPKNRRTQVAYHESREVMNP